MDFKKEFPVLQEYTYLNTAASGLLPRSVQAYRQQHDRDFMHQGSLLKDRQGMILTEVRETVGRFMGCAPERVALTPNFSYGFNTLWEGVPKQKKVLLLEGDYPSVNWPVTSRDFKVVYATIDAQLEQNIYDAVQKEHPDILALSLVQWINGIRIDLSFLKQLKNDFPRLLIVADGTQFCGTTPFNFEESGIDVLGASTYKWLNAGYGNAFFLFKEPVADQIAPRTSGFNSLQGKYKPQEGNFIGRFEPGHQDTLNYGSLQIALELIEQIGIQNISDQIRTLTKQAMETFVEFDLLQPMVVEREQHSSIFNLRADERLFNRLQKEGIICSQRGDGIRVSFHYFNTLEDLEHLRQFLV
ncbi:aminotransferase class V-fold PLP-dependent enzyme [Croceiramulus getboli]|nr:aminotransferase class V-fold PLP-dependent enzyme [Flavobacteriaceae bacterium YJPT1-3]